MDAHAQPDKEKASRSSIDNLAEFIDATLNRWAYACSLKSFMAARNAIHTSGSGWTVLGSVPLSGPRLDLPVQKAGMSLLESTTQLPN